MQALTTALPSSSSSQVRELEELCHSLADAAEASTAASKRLLVGKIKIEIGAPALDASRAVITAERFEIRDAVRQVIALDCAGWRWMALDGALDCA
jgi:hypothetical protein